MLRNLKSLFVVTEGTTEVSKSEKTTGNQIESVENAAKPTIKTIEKPVIDNAILDRLLQALEENNQSGFDYLEYRRSLKSLQALPMEEAIKFQSAFATASTMDVTLEKLLASIEFYKKVLQNEHDNFLKASKEQYNINVDSRIKEKESINKQIVEKSQQIQRLTEEIRAHQATLDELSRSIDTADNKIKGTTANFEIAMQVILSQMDEDAAKLKQYIK